MINQPQTYTLFATTDRYPFIEQEFKKSDAIHKLEYIGENNKYNTNNLIIEFKVTIENNVDLMLLFHSGIMYGIDFERNFDKKYKKS